ncbi:DUF58 domain-containing protein [Paenibacillus sp. HN-1]|uniref:DUF58 domain-containing protein n=1 Tax=Paenibacillus TaxID=44249 RepID=UPI001CA92F5A|nr:MULTISPECIES: DUF58 domain-containing protein [Paenibacillus]MBY9079823.1 DUF58 domain-containing protein [Paenibacillus sp. CGMCC 1.18879]MBY9084464.1 DUF58 domain-containing protein [Paenibacillus sinensis]
MNKKSSLPGGFDNPSGPSLPVQWARALAVLGLVGVLYGTLGGPALRFLLIFAVLGTLGGLLLHAAGPRRVELTRTVNPPKPQAGDSVEVTVSLRFRSRLPLPWMMVEERWTCGDHRMLLFPGFRRSFRYSYRLDGLPRGRQRLCSCRVGWGDLPGWFGGSCLPETDQSFLVLPAPLYTGELPAAMGGRMSRGPANRLSSECPDETGIRDYLPGDPLNRVDWKSSARKGAMQLRVPEREKGHMLCVVLDNHPSSYETTADRLPPRGSFFAGTPAFELAVSAVLGLLLAAERNASYAQLFTGGWPDGIARYEGLGALPPRVPELLAEIAPDGTRTLSDLLEDASRQWIPGMSVAVVTGCPNRDTALAISRLLAHGIRVDLYYVWDMATGSRQGSLGLSLSEEGAAPSLGRPDRAQRLSEASANENGGADSWRSGEAAPYRHGAAEAFRSLSQQQPSLCGSLGRLGAGLYCLEAMVCSARGEGAADERFRRQTSS